MEEEVLVVEGVGAVFVALAEGVGGGVVVLV